MSGNGVSWYWRPQIWCKWFDFCALAVKNAEQVLFHSTLEPNTEVFSKVSCGVLRSTKFRLNFAKQRRNDMQPS